MVRAPAVTPAHNASSSAPFIVSPPVRNGFLLDSPGLAFRKGSTPSRADAGGPTGDFDLAGDVQALAVEADDGEGVVHHTLRQQGLAVSAPGDALRPLPDFYFAHLRQRGSIDAEYNEQAVIVVEWMA